MQDYFFMTWGEAAGHSRVENNIPSWNGNPEVASGSELQGTHLMFQACLACLAGQVGIVDMAEAPEWCWGVQSAPKQRSGHPN